MPVHSAITSFMDQSPNAISATTLSCLTSCLRESGVVHTLITQHRFLCVELLSRLVNVANDNGKNAHARIMALECLYVISHEPEDAFRRGELFNAVQKLNESFEEFLVSQPSGSVEQQQEEMITVILLRCSGYTRLKAGDLLQQLFGGDDVRFVAALLSIMKNRDLEPEILVAALRCVYELTTPASYFVALDGGQGIETTKVSAFQDKVAALLIHLTQCNALSDMFEELNARWANTLRTSNLSPVVDGTVPFVLSTHGTLTTHYTTIFRYISVMLINVADFCDRLELVRAYQQSFFADHQLFLSATLIPFVQISLRGWLAGYDPNVESQGNPYMTTAIAALRFLRFSLYRASEAPKAPLIAALAALARDVRGMEPQLRSEYMGMLVLVLVVEGLCNVNASKVPGIANEFLSLVTTLSGDENPLRPGARFSTAQAFAYCLANEPSTYCVTQNETVTLLHENLKNEEAKLLAEAQTALAIRTLEEQMSLLRDLMMEFAVGQFLEDLCILAAGDAFSSSTPQGNEFAGAREGQESRGQKQKKKSRHPPEYVCMLTKKLMREPVVLKNGHRFELDALQEVVDRVGHVDPLSGESFNEELQVDMNLQQEIARYRVAIAAGKN